jgi:predicted GIY-YIG superfamily endonuclease
MNRKPEGADRLHGVYVIRHAETGEVLYVGMSNNPSNRIYLHHLARKSYWCFEPYTVAVHAAPNRTEAKRLERSLIESLCPRDNKHFRRVGMDVAPKPIDLPHAYTLDEFDDLMHGDYLAARAATA